MNVRIFTLIVALLFLYSCEHSSGPRGPFTPQLVVYSVISNTRTSQFVRVYSTYNPPELDPYAYREDSAVTGALVQIGSVVLRDTLLRRSQTSQDTETISAYTANPFAISHGSTYSLQVTSGSLGTVRSVVTVPDVPTARFISGTVLDFPRPDTRPPPPPSYWRRIVHGFRLSPLAKAYLVRMFIDFETMQGIGTVRHRWQVPLYGPTDTSFSDAMYPSVRYADQLAPEIVYSESSYVRTLTQIVFRYSILVKFTQVVVEVTQLGESLHTYSSVINGFQDELSLRLDQPDYSNISGGFGLFGAYTQDEFVRPFPQDFFFNPAPR